MTMIYVLCTPKGLTVADATDPDVLRRAAAMHMLDRRYKKLWLVQCDMNDDDPVVIEQWVEEQFGYEHYIYEDEGACRGMLRQRSVHTTRVPRRGKRRAIR